MQTLIFNSTLLNRKVTGKETRINEVKKLLKFTISEENKNRSTQSKEISSSNGTAGIRTRQKMAVQLNQINAMYTNVGKSRTETVLFIV